MSVTIRPPPPQPQDAGARTPLSMTDRPARPTALAVGFIDAMWAVVNWQDVARRYAAAKERGDSLLLALESVARAQDLVPALDGLSEVFGELAQYPGVEPVGVVGYRPTQRRSHRQAHLQSRSGLARCTDSCRLSTI